MAGVLIIGDAVEGRPGTEFLELAAAGAALAQATGEPLVGALIARDDTAVRPDCLPPLQRLYLIQNSELRHYAAASFVAAARAVLGASSPSIALFPHTLETRDWVPQLAAALDAGLVMDCVALSLEGNALIAIKPVYGGSVWGEFAIRGTPMLATLRPGVFTAAVPGGRTEWIQLAVEHIASSAISMIDEVAAAAPGGINLKNAQVIVSGGRGVGGAKNWHYIESAASALNAAVGCSRPVADSGWVSSAYTVGLSGSSVTPDLYIAVGISGAVQHLAGISAARTVVAINSDADAEIFARADLGVVGDYKEVLPAFIERIEQLKS
jgi:electron transfer flavoprotein alpha subunit